LRELPRPDQDGLGSPRKLATDGQ